MNINRPTTRRALLRGSALAAAALAAPWLRAQEGAASAPAPAASAAPIQRVPKLTLAGPYAAVSNALIRIAEGKLLADLADEVEFITWKDPDQLRALALEDGKADFIAMPSNVAANLYNRGVKLRLLNISVWRLLYIVSSDPAIKTLDDLRGKELLMPFRGDMPDIVFATLCEKLGIPIGKGNGIELRYTATPLDAMQMLLTRRAKHALLAEPAISTGMHKSRTLPVSAIAPALHRSVDMQQEWARAFGREPKIPQAGIAVMGPHLGNAPLVRRFMQAYEAAQDWCNTQPEECGKAVAARVDMLTPQGVADSMRAAPGEVVPAAAARPALEFFFERLAARQPKLIGGKLPDDNFYWNSAA